MKRVEFKSRSFFQWTLIVLTLFCVVLLLCSYAACFISPVKFSYLAFFGIAYPFILVVNLFFVFLWLFLWKRFIWVPFFAILLGLPLINALIRIDFNPEQFSSGSIKVMTLNIHNLIGAEINKKDKTIRSKVTSFFQQVKPDLICFQEFRIKPSDTLVFFTNFRQATQSNYYYYKNYNERNDSLKVDALATFSKFPIINSSYLRYPEKHVFAIYSDISIMEEKIRVYNVHLESIHFANDDYSFYSSLSDNELENVKLVPGITKIIEKLRKAFILRAKQAEVLRTSIDSSPYPVIICGDFNDTPSSYTYNNLTTHLYDSFKKAGGGFLGSTYAGSFPAFRIDYILYDKRFKVYEYQKYDVDLSDHYPVSVYLNINPSQ